jgi:hypothetical protein
MDKFNFGGWNMTRSFAVTTLPITLVALFCLSSAATAKGNNLHRCSTATVAGKWALTSTGSLMNIGPVAATGIVTFDRKGNLSGGQTRSLNGDVANETFTGTYTINGDCTGTDVVQVYVNGQLVRTTTLNVVFDENGRHVQGIFAKIELPDHTILPAVATLEANRLFPKDDD